MTENPFETKKNNKRSKSNQKKVKKVNLKQRTRYWKLVALIIIIGLITGAIYYIYTSQKSQQSVDYVGDLRDTPVESQYQNGTDFILEQDSQIKVVDNEYQIIVGDQIKPGVYTVSSSQDVFSPIKIYDQNDLQIHQFYTYAPFVNLTLNQGDKIVIEQSMFSDGNQTITFTAQDSYRVYDYTSTEQHGVYTAGLTLQPGEYEYRLDGGTEVSSFVYYNFDPSARSLEKERIAGDQIFGLSTEDYIDIDEGYLSYIQ